MFFWATGDFEGFLQDFALHRLLAQQSLQLLHLRLKRPVFGCRNNLLFGGCRRQCPSGRQLAPGEQLVRLNAVPTRDDAHRRVRLIGLVDDRQLLCRAPAPPTFRPGENFHLKIAASHITNITPTHLAKWGSMSGPFVTGRLLPRRFRLDASDDFFVVDEAVEEVVPGFRRTARIGKHLPQLIDAIVGQCGDCLIVTVYDADDTSIGQIVGIADDRLQEFPVFAEHFGDMVDGEDIGDGGHQAASAQMIATGAQFHGSSSSSLLIL